MYLPPILINFIPHLVKFLDYTLRQNCLIKQNIWLKYINCLFHKNFKMLYIQRSIKKVIFATEFIAMCLLLADLPVIKFSGSCKIFDTSKNLGWKWDVRSNSNAIFSTPSPRKRKTLENLVYIIYAVKLSETSFANKRIEGLHFVLKSFYLHVVCKSGLINFLF